MKLELYDAQKRIVNKARDREGLWLATGTGKTFVFFGLVKKHRSRNLLPIKALVIVTKNKVYDWKNLSKELGIEVDVIQKEHFQRDWKKLDSYNLVGVDEIHFFFSEKNLTRKKAITMSHSLRLYLDKHKPIYFYGMTATPYSVTNPWNFYVAWNLFTGAPPKMGRKKFREEFFTYIPHIGPRGIWKPKQDQKTIERLIAGYDKLGITLKSEEAFDMPEIIESVEMFQPTVEQNDLHMEMLGEYAGTGGVAYGYSHQIYGGGCWKGNEYRNHKFVSSDKFEALMDIIGSEKRIVVACKYNLEIERIEQEVLKRYPEKLVKVRQGKREDDIGDVNNDETKECVVIFQTASAVGIDVLHTSLMVFYSCPWKYIDYEQTKGRITRGKNVETFDSLRYVHLVTMGTIDQVVYERMKLKEDFNYKLYEKGSYKK